tara:strand:+ start:72 stop:1022 length:951 start_codon:yes stop_codon:yes gene_type:complete
MNNQNRISIVIIGYNTCNQLSTLLKSINNQKLDNQLIEIIYIDDGSSDKSFQMFNDFITPYKKISKKFQNNRGRVEATQAGITLASGKWLFFVRSNEFLNPNTLREYSLAIESNLGFAYTGAVNYKCNDKFFLNYLNNKKRGFGLFPKGSFLHYKYLLFNNSLIHKRVFKKLSLNKNFRYYGGEELEFAFRLNENYKNKIIAWPTAIVTRTDYPTFKVHCVRLEEFGSTNFLFLNHKLKKEVIKFGFLLHKNIFIKNINILIFKILYGLYLKSKNETINFYIIRACFLSSILKGYYSVSKSPDSKSSIVASSQSSD